MLDLLTIGDIKLDTFIVVPDASVMCDIRLPECKLCIAYGKKIPVTAMVSQIAGTAPNVAIGVAKFQKKTGVVSAMGNDDIHVHAKHFLKRHNVNTRHIVGKPGMKSSAATVLTFKGESTQFVAHANIEYRLTETITPPSWIHISELGEGYVHLYADAITMHKKHGTKISVNPGTIQIHEAKTALFNLLRVADILFLNMNEARTLLNIQNGDSILSIMAGLRNLGPTTVVVTDGAHGAYGFDGKSLLFCPIFPGKLIEATGAGDAFSSGFLGATLHDRPISDALMFGSINASSVVGHVGPTSGLLTFTDINSLIKHKPTYKTKKL